jgi:hypothetical protein
VSSIGLWAFLGCSKATIYCEHLKPDKWYLNWNPDKRPVQWNYKP